MTTPTRLPTGLIVMVFLVVIQGMLGFLRSFNLIRVGAALTGEGIFFIPLRGLVTMARGGLVAGIAILYIFFALGALKRRNWAWWVGVIAALTNTLSVLALVAAGEVIALPLVWGIVPIILLCYLIMPYGRQALKRPVPGSLPVGPN